MPQFKKRMMGSLFFFNTILACGVMPQLEIDAPQTLSTSTHVLTAFTSKSLTSISPDGRTYKFSERLPELLALQKSDIMLGAPSLHTPSGYLRRVVRVDVNHDIVDVETDDATLEEAFESLDLNFDEALVMQDPDSEFDEELGRAITNPWRFEHKFVNEVLYDQDRDLMTTNDQVRLNGKLVATIRLTGDIKISWFKLKEVGFSAIISEETTLTLDSDLPTINFEIIKKIKEIPLPSFGVGVITIRPKLTLSAGANAALDGDLEPSLTQNIAAQTGIAIIDNKFQWLRNWEHQEAFTGIKTGSSTRAKIFVEPKLSVEVLGLTMGYARATPSLSIKPSLNDTAASMQLDAGFTAAVGYDFSKFGGSKLKGEKILVDQTWLLKQIDFGG